MTILISPSEPKLFHSIGQTSSLPESRGVDFLWSAKGKLFGVQRKTLCLGPETRVLKADLTWCPISKIQSADMLMGFDENIPRPYGRRMWAETEVLGVESVRLPSYLLTLEDGQEIVSSGEHRWLCYKENATKWVRTENLYPAERYPQRPSRIVRLVDSWDTEESWEAGYLAGAFDGEGHLQQRESRGNGNAVVLTFYQSENEMLQLTLKCLDHFGFQYRVRRVSGPSRLAHWKPGFYVQVAPRIEILRFLGSIRPRRLLGQLRPNLLGQIYAKPRARSATVIAKQFIGEQDLVGLTTSTGTFVAEGLASHNSDFLASIGDRLNTAFHKAATLDTSILLLEGAWKWTRDGIWAEAKWGGRPFTRKQLWGLLASIQSRGHWIAHTADINETITYLEYLYSWSQKDKHDSLGKAPKVQSAWGGATETDKQAWAICVMCEGIGLEMAKRLVEANGGRVPLQLTMTPDEIKAVNGWGDKRVKVLTDAFGSMDHVGGERR